MSRTMMARLSKLSGLVRKWVTQHGLEAALLAAVLTIGLTNPAWAQKKSKLEQTPQPKSWVAGYFVVGLGITLGLLVLCRPGTRTTEFRREGE